MKIFKHAKVVLSMIAILAICLSVMSPLINVIAAGNSYTPPANMLYFKNENSGPLMQRLDLIPGKTYHISFGISDNAPKFAVVAKNSDRIDIDAKVTEISKTAGDSFTRYQYAVEIPSTVPKQSNKETARIFLGLSFETGKEGYVFDFSVVRSDDSSHANVLKNGLFESNLNDWAWGIDAWFTVSQTGIKKTEFSNDKITLKMCAFDTSKFKLSDKMLYFKGRNSDALMTRIPLIPGASYNLSFSLTNNVTEFSVIGKQDDDTRTSIVINSQEVTKETKEKYTDYVYSFTIPATQKVDAPDGKSLIFVGFVFPIGTEGYIFNIKLEQNDDQTHAQLMPNGDFKAGLDNWAWGYSWFVDFPGQKGLGKTEYNGSDAKLVVMDYDEEKFTLEAPEKKDKMLYFHGMNKDPLMNRATLEPGATYNLSFGLTNNVTEFSVIGKQDDSMRSDIAINSKEESKDVKERYTDYVYSFTVPADQKADASDGKALVFVGLSFPFGTEGYIFNVKLEKSDDQTHTPLLSNGDFQAGLDNWAWGFTWFVDFPGQSGLGKTEYDGSDVKLVVMDYDEEKFTLESPDNMKDKMLYFKNEITGPLTQRVTVEPGASYRYSFSVSANVVGFKVTAKTDSRYDINVNPKLITAKEENRHCYYEYEITFPADLTPDASGGKALSFVGLTLITGYDGYFYNAKLEKVGDAEHTQLLNNGDFKSGLDYWEWDYNWFINFPNQIGFGLKEYTTKTNDILKVVDFDESKFSAEKPDVPVTNHRMLSFKNGANPTLFAQLVTYQPDTVFELTFSAFSTSELDFAVASNVNGARSALRIESELVDKKEYTNYTTYKYQFTTPAAYEEKRFFAGLNIPYYAEGFIFDMSCKIVGDETNTEQFGNNGLLDGLDRWIWGWHAWFGMKGAGWQESGLNYWTNGIDEIKIMDFDLSKIDTLIADINRDDGVWWNAADYNENANTTEKTGTATLTGSFCSVDKTPIKNVKLLLKSEQKNYSAYTNKFGNFAFKNIIPGSYDLYFVNKNGDEVSTGYYETLEDGDVVSIALVSDPSGLLSGEDEETADRASFAGTVYTPKLKTVPNLKIYLRDVGEVKTDKNGSFAFEDVPVGEYELYTVLPSGKEYVFRTVKLEKNVQLTVKLKYDVKTDAKSDDNGNNTTLIVIISVVAGVIILGAGATAFVIIKKKKPFKTKK